LKLPIEIHTNSNEKSYCFVAKRSGIFKKRSHDSEKKEENGKGVIISLSPLGNGDELLPCKAPKLFHHVSPGYSNNYSLFLRVH